MKWLIRTFSVTIIISIILSIFAVQIFAAARYDKLGDIIASSDVKQTDEIFMNITRPAQKETTSNKNILICGVTKKGVANKESLKVVLALYNPDKDIFEEYKDTSDKSRFSPGELGLFTAEAVLPYEGLDNPNRIKLVIYRENEVKSLKAGKNIQISYFNIIVLKENKNLLNSIKDSILNIFSNKK